MCSAEWRVSARTASSPAIAKRGAQVGWQNPASEVMLSQPGGQEMVRDGSSWSQCSPAPLLSQYLWEHYCMGQQAVFL